MCFSPSDAAATPPPTPPRRSRRRPTPRRLGALAALLLGTSSALAADRVWVPVEPGAAPGTEARIELVPAGSSALRTTVEVHISGFWSEDVVGDDGDIYQRLDVPGLPSGLVPGEPELPQAPLHLAVPTTASEISLITSSAQGTVIIPGVHVWPAPVPGDDDPFDPLEDPGPGDTTGSDDQFLLDPTVYGSSGYWPATPSAGPVAVMPTLGAVPGASLTAYPVQWDPALDRLSVSAVTTYVIDHSGALQALGTLTKTKALLASTIYVNWPSVEFGFQFDLGEYHARYLIVANPFYAASGELNGFALIKKILGFDTEIRSPATFSTTAIADEIEAWYQQGDPGADHFVLLIGDVNALPQFDLPFFGLTDDPYARPGGGPFADVHLGRLSVDDLDDLGNQLQKIIAYQLDPVTGVDYGRVVLAAHAEDAPFKYTLAHAQVAGASYSVPPDFVLQYGAFGATDASVRAAIDAGVGLVAYRGHGSTYAWSDWNLVGEDFHKNDVGALMNGATIRPIVWSFSCTNSNVAVSAGGFDDCIGEAWLENETVGGVAHYGATDTTKTAYNDDLDKLLFKLVFDGGAVVHGQALDLAEQVLYWAGWGGANQSRYMLLGDPSMTIRRGVVDPPTVSGFPFQLGATGPGDTVDVPFDVFSSGGAPLEGALVSLFKASGIPGGGDEILANAYTNAFGSAGFVLEVPTSGALMWAVQDGLGNVTTGVIPVQPNAAWVDLGNGLAGTLGQPVLTGEGSLQGGTPYAVHVTDAAPLRPAWIVFGFSALFAPFKGGVLVPRDDLILGGLLTAGDGTLVLGGTWPSGIPAGVSFFLQAWISDVGGPVGFAATNGVRATTP